jgi:hypothetical protein
MAGFIYSETQVELFRFLERVGPCPTPALAVIFGKRVEKHLFRLRQQGYIYNLTLNEIVFWIPQDYGRFNPRQQEVMAWFAARMIEAGGTIDGKVGVSPSGAVMLLTPDRGRMIIDSDGRKFEAALVDLRTKPMKECLRTV